MEKNFKEILHKCRKCHKPFIGNSRRSICDNCKTGSVHRIKTIDKGKKYAEYVKERVPLLKKNYQGAKPQHKTSKMAHTVELNKKLVDIRAKTKVDWNNEKIFREINTAIHSKSIYLKEIIIKKYEFTKM